MRFKAIAVLVTLITTLMMPLTPAVASSQFDSVITPTTDGKLILNSVDVTTDWLTRIRRWSADNSSDTGVSDTLVALDATMANYSAGWGVFYCPSSGCGGGGYGQLVVLDPNSTATFGYRYNGSPMLYMPAIDASKTISFYIDNSGVFHASSGISAVAVEGSSFALYTYPSNPSINSQIFFLKQNVSYPDGYAGYYAPTTQPAARYVAMGDSFSSGEGNPWYEAGSDKSNDPGKNICHRSPEAYPRLLSRDSNLNLGYIDFVACSGATTDNVQHGGSADGAWNEPAQVNVLSADTQVVTLTVGGNDVGFASYALGCTINCGPGTPTYSAIMDAINAPAFKDSLKTTYDAILQKAPIAQVYVADYPYMAKEYTEAEILAGEGRCGGFNLNGTRDVQAALNTVIAQAISSVGSTRLHYVNTNAQGSPFVNKYLCTDVAASSDFGETTLHPNYQGHDDYAYVIKNAMQS